jgi:hypothetical protein
MYTTTAERRRGVCTVQPSDGWVVHRAPWPWRVAKRGRRYLFEAVGVGYDYYESWFLVAHIDSLTGKTRHYSTSASLQVCSLQSTVPARVAVCGGTLWTDKGRSRKRKQAQDATTQQVP